jgi:hypothetical protein
MNKRLIRILYGAYLGGILSLLFDTNSFTDWRWWVVVIPTLLLAEWGFRVENED